MRFGGDVEHLAEGPLAVGAEERGEGSKLIPACVQFAPLLEIGVFVAGEVVLPLGGYIAVLDTEAADVHGPVGDSAYREVKSRRYLRFHVLPAGGDVAAPCGGRVALKSRESRAGKQEHTLVGLDTSLSVVDGLGIHQGVGVEVFGRRTECRWG